MGLPGIFGKRGRRMRVTPKDAAKAARKAEQAAENAISRRKFLKIGAGAAAATVVTPIALYFGNRAYKWFMRGLDAQEIEKLKAQFKQGYYEPKAFKEMVTDRYKTMLRDDPAFIKQLRKDLEQRWGRKVTNEDIRIQTLLVAEERAKKDLEEIQEQRNK